MTSRKANQARFVGVAAWLFRKRWVAGLLGLFAFCSPAWAEIPRCRERGREREQGGRQLQPWERGRGHSRGSADNALESSGAFFQQLAGMQGQALQLPDRANVQQPLVRAGGGHFWWIHLSLMSARAFRGPDRRFGKQAERWRGSSSSQDPGERSRCQGTRRGGRVSRHR